MAVLWRPFVAALVAVGLMGGAQATTHIIRVGYPIGQDAFSPSNLTAKKGDIVSFQFYPANHSVVKMDPNNACIPYDTVHPGAASWWSGFFPMTTTKNPPPSWNLTINNTDPVWFYCSAPNSCNKMGMVGIINPPDDDGANLTAIELLAMSSKTSLSPGEAIPAEGGDGTSSSTTPSSTSSSSSSDPHDHSLSSGAIAGIAIGSVAAFALIGLLFFFVGRKKKSDELKASAAAAAAPAPNPDAPMAASGSPPPWGYKPSPDDGATAAAGAVPPMSEHPHRISELASQNYDPVEMDAHDIRRSPGEGPRL